MNRCFKKQQETALSDISGIVEAVMWEPKTILKNDPLSSNKAQVSIWTSVPKPDEPVSFDSAILWAQQTGNAAKMGYEVVFREPRLHEMFSDTPVRQTLNFHETVFICAAAVFRCIGIRFYIKC